MGNEPRRRFKRFSPVKTAVACILPKSGWSLFSSGKNLALRVQDVSMGGAHLVCSRQLKPGTRTWVVLGFASASVKVFIEAAVRWCRRDTMSLNPRWETGLQFVRLESRDAENLQAMRRMYLGA